MTLLKDGLGKFFRFLFVLLRLSLLSRCIQCSELSDVLPLWLISRLFLWGPAIFRVMQ